jgi:2'-hydroxyisoflavone reductase
VDVLLLGGGVFLGRALSRELLARGHKVVCLSRGRSLPGAVDGVEVVTGDRRDPEVLTRLARRDWDAVLDTCAYRPADLEAPLEILGPVCGCWQLISTVSVYAPPYPEHPDEDAPLLPPVDPGAPLAENYGALKAMCEDMLLEDLEERALVVRPGLIVGPEDPSDRFGWWVRELAGDGPAGWPDARRQPVQWVDVRDLAAFCVHLLEEGAEGVVQVAGPARPPSLPELLERVAARLRPGWTPPFLPEARWTAAGIQPWADLPLWLPEDEYPSFRVDISRALSAGLALRPLEETVDDTLAWLRGKAGGAARPGLGALLERVGG